MDTSDARKYRSAVARLNFVGADRPDLQYAVKEASPKMAKPKHNDMKRVEYMARYLKVSSSTRTCSYPGKRMILP